MKTLKDITIKNINEGFYSNTGAKSSMHYEQAKEYLDKLQNFLGHDYYLRNLRADHYSDNSTNKNIDGIIVDKYYSKGATFVLCPQTVDPNITEIPEWFKFVDENNKEVLTKDNLHGSIRDIHPMLYCTIHIKDLPKLKSLKGLPYACKGFHIIDCPNITVKELANVPAYIGDGGFTFKPSEDTHCMLKDVFKYVKKIEGKVNINQEKGTALQKLSDLRSKQSAEAKTQKSTSTTNNMSNSGKNYPDVARAKAEGRIIGRMSFPAFVNVDDAPKWICRKSDYTIANSSGDIVGFTTKKLYNIYRKGMRYFKIVCLDGNFYATDKNGSTVAQLVIV